MAHGMTCAHNWCDRNSHDRDGDTHESRAIEVPGINNMAVEPQVSYRDGDREPTIWIAAVQYTAAGLGELIAVLQEQQQIMRAVETTPALPARAA